MSLQALTNNHTFFMMLSDWPPALTDAQWNELTLLAVTYAFSHGLLYLPPSSSTTATPRNHHAPPSAIHAPISLVPAPFPRGLFEEAQRLQRLYNVLYARIALDEAFLDSVLGEVASADDFTGNLWRSWKRIRDEGIREQWHLGIFRSDYLLHAPGDSDGAVALKQVEFNTISSSFGVLSERVSGLHKYLLTATEYYGCSEHLKRENFPENRAVKNLVEGLAAAHDTYGVNSACILFVVQPGERNIFDQRPLEYELLERCSIRVIRQTFNQLLTSASLSSDRTLFISGSEAGPSVDTRKVEISVIYFRAGYTDTDYAVQAHYDLRELLSRSRAISCPTLALQLAGGKKVQQVLTRPGVLERFLLPTGTLSSSGGSGGGDEKDATYAEPFGPERFTHADLAAIRATWVHMWGLDERSHGLDGNGVDGDDDGVSRALSRASSLVLKPQREGGGNNIYRSSIPSFLASLPERERIAWIAMELIQPPHSVGGHFVKAGTGEGTGAGEVVSELGVFGWALFRSGDEGRKESVRESTGGWLVRTKGREADEGGVAVGFSVLDSVVLVD